MISSLKFNGLWFIKFIVINDIIQELFVLISVINAQRKSLSSKSTNSTNSMEVSGTVGLHLSFHLVSWNIVIDDKFSFWDINTSGDQVCSYQYIDLLFSELLHGLISFFFCHFREHDVRFETSFIQLCVDCFREIFRVDEDVSLCHFACFENFFNEI